MCKSLFARIMWFWCCAILKKSLCNINCYSTKPNSIKLNYFICFPFLPQICFLFSALFTSYSEIVVFFFCFSCTDFTSFWLLLILLLRLCASSRLRTEVPSTQCLREELVWLQQSLSMLGSPVVLCHNDLLCKNIIYNQEAGEYKLNRCSRRHYCVTDLCCSVNYIGPLHSGRIALPQC